MGLGKICRKITQVEFFLAIKVLLAKS